MAGLGATGLMRRSTQHVGSVAVDVRPVVGDPAYALAVSGPTDLRIARGDRTRRAILDRSVDIASVEGLEGLSIGRLAADLHASKSGVFAHFGSKEELQLATIEAASQLYVERIVTPGLSGPPGLRRVWRLVDHWLRFFKDGQLPGLCFFTSAVAEFDARPEGRVRDAIKQLQRQWRDGFLELLEDAKSLGELASETDTRQLFFEIDALVTRAILDVLMHGETVAFRRARAGILHRLRAVATTPSMLPAR
jgi:AcrR family transcriptional regulator